MTGQMLYAADSATPLVSYRLVLWMKILVRRRKWEFSSVREQVHNSPNLIYPVGAQVVTRKSVQGSNGRIAHPSGAVGVIVKSPMDRQHTYRVRFTDGFEAPLHHDNLMRLAEYKQGSINDPAQVLANRGLFDRVIFRCVIGSRAYGLDEEQSDIDRRGIYLPPADLHWSLNRQFFLNRISSFMNDSTNAS